MSPSKNNNFISMKTTVTNGGGHKRGNSTLISNASAAPLLNKGFSSHISEIGLQNRGFSKKSSLRESSSSLVASTAI